jgi:predicted NAD/FAD-dependent oxidoreductase
MAGMQRVAVIGAGMAGLACARRLADAGLEVVVLDKGRGIGGRLATRRAGDGLQFDHGAQYVTARGEAFGSVLDDLRRAGAAAAWDDGSGRPHLVGTPGMSALPRHLARGLDVRLEVEVSSVRADAGGWLVASGDERLRFDRVVVTAPAPQTATLLGPDSPLAAELAPVRLDPCLTLMAALDADAPRPFASRADPGDPLAWIAQDSTKPGRTAPACWVAQAGPSWSAAHFELDRDAIAALMLPLLCERLGADPGVVRHASAHRWRYAKVAAPLGRPFARDASGTLQAGGDWCLDARVEAAWTSGDAIARDILVNG